MTETTLRFIGDLNGSQGIMLASVASILCWLLYFRESRHRAGSERWTLPTLRALTVFLVVIILSEPVLHHEKSLRELGRLFVFVDGSQSMELTDQSMSPSRKLASLQSLGILNDDKVMATASRLDKRMAQVESLQSQLQKELDSGISEKSDELVRSWASETERACADFDQLVRMTIKPEKDDRQRVRNQAIRNRLDRVERDLVEPARRLAEEIQQRRLNPEQATSRLSKLRRSVSRIRSESELAVQRYSEMADDQDVVSAMETFDGLSRWDRCDRLLLGESHGLLPKLMAQQDIELMALRDSEAIPVWWQRQAGNKSAGPLPDSFALLPNGFQTDLGDALKAAIREQSVGTAVVLFSDGAHNRLTSSPIGLARALGRNNVPIFVVGVGSKQDARDMSIVGLEHPGSVFAEDYVRGKIQLRDHMTPGKAYRLEIKHQGESVWSQPVYSQNSGLRQVGFEFSLKPLLEQIQETRDSAEEIRSCPLQLSVTLDPDDVSVMELEAVAANNSRPMFLQAVTQRRKILILDGRPRWESRYVRNLFQRQSNWEVQSLLDGLIDEQAVDPKSGLGNRAWRRTGEYRFPESEEELFQYDLVILGDLPPSLLTEEEMKWLSDFVGQRGGGLIFMDGRRGNLVDYRETPLGKLLPVEFFDSHERVSLQVDARLTLTAEGSTINALRLDGSINENRTAWQSLPAPKWTAPARALPGSTTHVRMSASNNDRDVMVMRRFGAGKTLYLGSDELWRWRYNVGDRLHQKFWNQVANWIGMQPFAVVGEYVSIGTDQGCYEADSSMAFHVAMRDEVGNALIDSDADLAAVVYRDGQIMAEIPLLDDGQSSGIFRGQTGRMEPGNYRVAVVKREGYGRSHEFEATAELIVKPVENAEMTELKMNEQLLREMARSSGGEYFNEYELRKLGDAIKERDQRKVISSETPLGHSWYWFVPVIALLTAEWVIRKRTGCV